MKAHDLLELATRNLRASLLRNSLTTLGIAVGVASLVAMLALGVGLQELASKRLTRSGLFDSITVFSRSDRRGPGRAEPRANPAPTQSRALDESVRREIERLANVVEVFAEIRFATEVRYNRRTHFAVAAGLPSSARDNDALADMQGQFFSGPLAEEAIVQVDFARELAEPPAALIGQDLVLQYAERQPRAEAKSGGAINGAGRGFSIVPREKKLRIVGIVQTEPVGSLGGFGRGRLFLPLQLAQSLRPVQYSDLRDVMRAADASATYTTLTVRVASPAQVGAVEEAIKRMGFSTFSLLGATRNLRRFFAVLDLFLGIFGSLALAVASLGVVNTLVMAILERRREIGILKALGASDTDIQRLFLAEAGAMGFSGGMVGVGLGWAIGRVINVGANVYLRRQELPPETIWSVPWWLVAGAIGFAVLVSLASGSYPAARAAKLDPVQALRYE